MCTFICNPWYFQQKKKYNLKVKKKNKSECFDVNFAGKPAKFHLYENSCVNAEFRGCDIDLMELYVRNLITPLGTIPEAILRTSDVIVVEVNKL